MTPAGAVFARRLAAPAGSPETAQEEGATMATPKAPQDRKPKAQDAELAAASTRTVTIRGQEFNLLASISDDFELLLDLGRLQNAVRDGRETVSVMQMVSLFLRMVPDDEISRALALVRSESGTVHLESGVELLTEFIAALNPNS